MQESGGVAIFNPTDKLFKSNLKTAKSISLLPEDKILEIITIPGKVGDFVVPKELAGKVAKFRLEPGYWAKYKDRDPETRFRMSASWGLTQVMGANIATGSSANLNILHFSANIEWQLRKAADMLEKLLILSKGDINKMYRGYNSGNINSLNPAVLLRAAAVEKKVREF